MLSIVENARLQEVRDGFLRLFELQVNGVISPLEEKRRKELAIQYLKVSDKESDEDATNDEDEDVLCGGCADGILRRVYVCFRLIDP